MLINDKTPEQIKNGLRRCKTVCLDDCPYYKTGIKCSECTTHLSKDALAYIQHLEAQQPKWISVKERLPEERDIYLAHTVHRHNRSDSYWCVCVEYFNPEDGWSSLSDLYEVAHWMPLPQPPEEAE